MNFVSQWNWEYVAAAALVCVVFGILLAQAWKSNVAKTAAADVESGYAHVKAKIEKHLHHGPAELVIEHPFVADHPAVPVSDAQQKSVSTPVAPAVAWSDRVAAKHAALDKRIADGQAAQVEKDALTVLQANLDKLTAGA